MSCKCQKESDDLALFIFTYLLQDLISGLPVDFLIPHGMQVLSTLLHSMQAVALTSVGTSLCKARSDSEALVMLAGFSEVFLLNGAISFLCCRKSVIEKAGIRKRLMHDC